MSGTGGTDPRRAVLAVALTAVMVGSVLTTGVAFVGTATAAQSVTSCTTIDESGEYALTSDIEAGGETCIEITASDVTLDGNGHTLAGGGGAVDAYGVYVDGGSNVTVTDVTTTQWFIGYHVRDASNVGMTDADAVDNKYYGYWVVTSERVNVEDSAALGHTRGEGEGFSIIRSSDLVFENVTAVGNDYGVHIDNNAQDMEFVDSTIGDNNNWGYYMRGYNDGGEPANVTASNLTIGDTVVDVHASQNVVIEGASALPTAPDEGQAVGAPLRTSRAGGSASPVLNLSVHYGDADVDGIDESSLGVWQYDTNGGAWAVSDDAGTVDADANTVTSTVDLSTYNTFLLSLVGQNATDGGGADPAAPASFEVASLDAPANVTQGETVPVTATVENTGESEGTQTVEFRIDLNGDGTPEAIGLDESVTLAAGASETVTFEVPTEGVPAGAYTHGVFTDDDGATAEITVEEPAPEPEPTATVALDNQTANDTTVTVDSVTMSEGGFVTVHNGSLLDGNALGSVVGVSEYLPAGTHENVTVTLYEGVLGANFSDDASPTDGETLIAMPHLDTNGNEAYDFVASGGQADGPYTANGSAVVDPATITVADDGDDGGDGDGPDEPTEPERQFYQIDFVAGEPIEELSADSLYAKQDRLVQFALGSTDDGITERGSAWASEDVREVIVEERSIQRTGDTAEITFTLAEGADDVTMSLVSYAKPTAGFSEETADQQELFDATTETLGPGTHTITVELPDATDDSADANGTADLTTVSVRGAPAA